MQCACMMLRSAWWPYSSICNSQNKSEFQAHHIMHVLAIEVDIDNIANQPDNIQTYHTCMAEAELCSKVSHVIAYSLVWGYARHRASLPKSHSGWGGDPSAAAQRSFITFTALAALEHSSEHGMWYCVIHLRTKGLELSIDDCMWAASSQNYVRIDYLNHHAAMQSAQKRESQQACLWHVGPSSRQGAGQSVAIRTKCLHLHQKDGNSCPLTSHAP